MLEVEYMRVSVPRDGILLIYADGTIRTLGKEHKGSIWIIVPEKDLKSDRSYMYGYSERYFRVAGQAVNHLGGFMVYLEGSKEARDVEIAGLGSDE